MHVRPLNAAIYCFAIFPSLSHSTFSEQSAICEIFPRVLHTEPFGSTRLCKMSNGICLYCISLAGGHDSHIAMLLGGVQSYNIECPFLNDIG